jgi:hypothetical protein
MELTASFVEQLQHFAPVFTTPTFQTFVEVVTGWTLSHRHRYVTELIFAGGNVGKGHSCRFYHFFSQAAWDMEGNQTSINRLLTRKWCDRDGCDAR